MLNMTYEPDEVEWKAIINSENFTYLGEYSRIIACNYTNGNVRMGDNSAFTFIVTNTGLEHPGEWLSIFFILLLGALSLGFLVTLFMIVEDFATADMNVYDVCKYLSMFLILILTYYFHHVYIQDYAIEYILSITLKTAGITHVFIPFVGLFYSIFVKQLNEMRKIRGIAI